MIWLSIVDWCWHRGPYQLTVRWADRLHLFMYRRVCTRVEGL